LYSEAKTSISLLAESNAITPFPLELVEERFGQLEVSSLLSTFISSLLLPAPNV
jgi:hypothetical protein